MFRQALLAIVTLAVIAQGCGKKEDDPLILPPVSPIVAEVTTPASPRTGDITIDYTLTDDRTPAINADVKVYYSANGAWFQQATIGSGGDGTTDLLTAAAPGAPHTFVWDSLSDLPAGLHSVIIRVEPYDTGTNDWGTAGQSGSFQVLVAEASASAAFKVFDPKLASGSSIDLGYRIDPPGVVFNVTVGIETTGGIEVRRLVDAQLKAGGTGFVVPWDGRNDSGKFVDPGEYDVVVEATGMGLPSRAGSERIYIVRLGIAGIEFVDNAGSGEEHQLMYHIRNSSKYNYYAIPEDRAQWALGPDAGELADLDTDDGLPRPLPAPWTDLDSPPQDATDTAGVEDDTYNLPVCYERLSIPAFEVTLGSSAVSNATPGNASPCGYPVTGLPIRVLVSGASPASPAAGENISPGGSVSFTCSAGLPDAVQENTLDFTFTFEYKEGGFWQQVPGSISTSHTVYTIFDKPVLTESASPVAPYIPWVRLVDMVCAWIDGYATSDTVCIEVAENLNSFFGIQYDTSSGAPGYAGGAISAHVLEMSDFIEDYDGATFSTVNCSDCACLLATFANTVGVDHEYLILADPYSGSENIPLNYMIPIGRSWMVPFSGYFNYHAVSTADAGLTISDACCTLDCDGDNGPASSPSVHTSILPVNMLEADYNGLLSWDPSEYGVYGIWRPGQH